MRAPLRCVLRRCAEQPCLLGMPRMAGVWLLVACLSSGGPRPPSSPFSRPPRRPASRRALVSQDDNSDWLHLPHLHIHAIAPVGASAGMEPLGSAGWTICDVCREGDKNAKRSTNNTAATLRCVAGCDFDVCVKCAEQSGVAERKARAEQACLLHTTPRSNPPV